MQVLPAELHTVFRLRHTLRDGSHHIRHLADMILDFFRLPKLVLNGLRRLVGACGHLLHGISCFRHRIPQLTHLAGHIQNPLGHLSRYPHHTLQQRGNILLLPIQLLQLGHIDLFQRPRGKIEENRHQQKKRHADLIGCHVLSPDPPGHALPDQKYQIDDKACSAYPRAELHIRIEDDHQTERYNISKGNHIDCGKYDKKIKKTVCHTYHIFQPRIRRFPSVQVNFKRNRQNRNQRKYHIVACGSAAFEHLDQISSLQHSHNHSMAGNRHLIHRPRTIKRTLIIHIQSPFFINIIMKSKVMV